MAKRRYLQRKASRHRDRIREENAMDRIFLLHLHKSLYVIIVWAASILLHNILLSLARIDEPFFVFLAIYIIPIYILISVTYTLAKHRRIEQ
jgi:hypothetical protein